MKFNKKNCIENIYLIAKEKDMKIGDIEEAAGVSRGYFSRINKEDVDSLPSIELLMSVSEQLQIPLSLLIYGLVSNLNENDRYVMSFINKLIFDSMNNTIQWNKENESSIEELAVNENKSIKHPLFVMSEKRKGLTSVNKPIYNSKFFQNAGVDELVGNIYYTNIEKFETKVYISRLLHKENNKKDCNNYEINIFKEGSITPFCCSLLAKDEVKDRIIELYQVVDNLQSNYNFSNNIKKDIDKYLYNK